MQLLPYARLFAVYLYALAVAWALLLPNAALPAVYVCVILLTWAFPLKALAFVTGNLVFHGPREDVVPYFQSLGFYVPERKAVSDFLQEVTSQKDQQVGFQFCSCKSCCLRIHLSST